MTSTNDVTDRRIHALDAVRGLALLLGLVFHASMSFLPVDAWVVLDHSRSTVLAASFFSSHIFRMVLFFTIAGFFAHLLLQRRGLGGFWANRLLRIGVPLVGGWVVIAPLILAVSLWAYSQAAHGGLPKAPPPMSAPPAGYFPLTHLWFLYYLLVFYAAACLLRALAGGLDPAGRSMWLADRLIAWIVRSRLLVAALGLPAAWVLYRLPDWALFFGVPTPDSSIIPQLPAVAAFGTAFAVGWLLHRQPALLESLQRGWVLYGVVALGLTALCLHASGLAPGSAAAGGLGKLGLALAYSTAGWCWSFGIMGLALRYLREENRARRYLADASYWIYLTHMPLVMTLQVLLAPLTWPALVKFPLIVAATLAMLLTSYHYLVRPTWVGALLNGRRYPRRAPALPAAALAAAAVAQGAPGASGALAELHNVSKRYGTVTALKGLDLTVGPGELLAVLGPNGAGKSTAIALCLGLTQADAGEVRVLGRSPQDIEARRSVGVMMQEVFLAPELRVRELVALASTYYPNPLPTAQVLELTGTREIASRLYGKLSGGQKRQAQLAIAVCGQPQLLFLDEPTVGLDVQAREALWRTLRLLIERGCSIVLTTHYLEEAEALADRVVVLAHGQCIAHGTVDEIRSRVSRRQIRCETTVSEATAREWPGVIQAHRDGRHLTLTVADAEAVVQRLFASDPNVRGLEVHQAGLAEAFAELTKEVA